MILIGTLVYWNDPAIMDYSKEDRKIVSNIIYKVIDINDDEGTAIIIDEDNPINEVEVNLSELTAL